MAWLVAPTEPPELKALGIVCLNPEEYGADFLTSAPNGLIAIQRKTFNDLLNSLYDGRLQTELGLLGHPEVSHPFLLVEGRPLFTADGFLLSDRRRFTKSQWTGLVLSSIVESKVPVLITDDIQDTAATLLQGEKWFAKPGHNSLRTRPKPSDDWGDYTHRQFRLQLWQSFKGVGVERAEALDEYFGGKLPLKWLTTEKELQQIPGVGKVTARALIELLQGEQGGETP